MDYMTPVPDESTNGNAEYTELDDCRIDNRQGYDRLNSSTSQINGMSDGRTRYLLTSRHNDMETHGTTVSCRMRNVVLIAIVSLVVMVIISVATSCVTMYIHSHDTNACSSNPCEFGHCRVQAESHTCKCFSGYAGVRCDRKITPGQWVYVFGAKNGTGMFVYETWVDNNYICTDPHCLIFKNEIVREWNDLRIVKVRVALYVGSDVVAWLEFNGTNTDTLNWFSESRLTRSSWRDILNSTHNAFSIHGNTASVCRRFYISHYWGGCSNDKQWLTVSEHVRSCCDWDTFESYPQFQYALAYEVADIHNMGLAEWFKIFIQEEE